MEKDYLKKACARQALKLIKDGQIVGLGGGGTISYLVSMIADASLNIKIVTPSDLTKALCIKKGLTVLDLAYVNHVDIAFDGCDECDELLHALKSGGGIHTREKLIGTMADQYILLVDESKLSNQLPFTHPVVLEVLPIAYSFVVNQVKALGGKVEWRHASNKDGFIYSDNGNLLLDTFFNEVSDIELLAQQLDAIKGLVDHSLFVGVVNKIIVVSNENTIVIESERTK